MNPSPLEFMQAARVPSSLRPQHFGDWTIQRRWGPFYTKYGWSNYTLLLRYLRLTPDWSNLHLVEEDGFSHATDTVMEDSPRELRRHLSIWMNARGRVLITGLGLGCVVRGLLTSPDVEHVDVVEIDADIIRVVGPEFEGDQRVKIYHADALEFEGYGSWDYAWHDIWTPQNDGLDKKHAEIISRFAGRTQIQGAWQFPRPMKRMMSMSGFQFLG